MRLCVQHEFHRSRKLRLLHPSESNLKRPRRQQVFSNGIISQTVCQRRPRRRPSSFDLPKLIYVYKSMYRIFLKQFLKYKLGREFAMWAGSTRKRSRYFYETKIAMKAKTRQNRDRYAPTHCEINLRLIPKIKCQFLLLIIEKMQDLCVHARAELPTEKNKQFRFTIVTWSRVSIRMWMFWSSRPHGSLAEKTTLNSFLQRSWISLVFGRLQRPWSFASFWPRRRALPLTEFSVPHSSYQKCKGNCPVNSGELIATREPDNNNHD